MNAAADIQLPCRTAALECAKRGWHVFPATIEGGAKKGCIRGANGNGRRWGNTTDPALIQDYWRQFPLALLGIACGAESGLFVVECDTLAAHGKDGIGNLQALIAENGGLPETVEAVSPTGSVHYYFRWPEGIEISNSADQVAPGVDVRGDGGMVIAAPSVRPGHITPYRWKNPPETTALADCPQWLLDRCKKVARPLVIDTGRQFGEGRAGIAEVGEMLSWIDPDEGSYQDWCDILMALHDHFGGSQAALEMAEDWSRRGAKYMPGKVQEKWGSFTTGGGVTVATIAQRARQNGADLSAITRRHRVPAASSPRGGSLDKSAAPEPNEFREMSNVEREAVEPVKFIPWGLRDLAAIPVPEFLYAGFYARGYTSVTVAAPKVGKSMLGLAEAVDMASGRGFLTGAPTEKLRVAYWNAEDDQSVIDGRVAALLGHYGIEQEEIAETLFAVSGVEAEGFYMVTGQDGTINEPVFVGLEKFITAQRADVLIFDPLQDLSRSPETNEVFRILGQRLRRLATGCKVAIGLIHHTRKLAPGTSPTLDDGRGGSALRGTARFNRLLVPMTEDEAAKAGVQNHRHFMRIGDIESNLAPPSADVNRWFQKISVPTPNGHSVGAVEPWTWPDAFAGVTVRLAARCQAAVAACDPPARQSVQASDWVGHVIGPVLDLNSSDRADRARLSTIIKRWVEEDVLRVASVASPRDGRAVPVVVVGENRMSEGLAA